MKKKLSAYPITQTLLTVALSTWLVPALAWQPLGSGVNGTVKALVVDSNNNLYVGGTFTQLGDSTTVNNIAKWNGQWSALGATGVTGGTTPSVNALVLDSSNIYVGGAFTNAGGTTVSNIAKWTGSAWSAIGSGTNAAINALTVNSGTLYAGGSFSTAGGTTVKNIAKWNGSAWSPLTTNAANDPSVAVNALAYQGGSLFAGSALGTTPTNASSVVINRIGAWDSVGGSWASMPASGASNGVTTGLSKVTAIATDGSNVFIGGNSFIAIGNGATSLTAYRVAKWDGSAWSALSNATTNGLNGNGVNALAVDAANNKVYAGGTFQGTSTTTGTLQTSINAIARWNTSSSTWSRLGGNGTDGLYNGNTAGAVNALAVDKDGNVYAGGTFATVGTDSTTAVNPQAGNVAASNIAVYTSTDLVGGTVSGSDCSGQWKLVSLPHYEAGGTSVSAAFDSLPASSYNTGGDAKGWVVYRYTYGATEAADAYAKVRSDKLVQGQGYFVKSCADGVMDMDGIETPVTTQATNTHCASAKGCYVVDLTSPVTASTNRYNLVGNPFINRINWDDVRFEVGGTKGNPATSGTAYTPAGAQTANIADNKFAVYNGSNYSMGSAGTPSTLCTNPDTACIKPMQGFWIRLLPASISQTIKLLIPKP